SDDPRQDECSAAVGDDADPGERLHEVRARGREHDVAREGQVRARAGGDAVHGTDDGFLQLANGANHGVVAVANDVAQVGHLAIARRRFGEVLSGTKASAGTREYDGT